MRYSASDRAVNRGFEDAVAASGTEGSGSREVFEASVGSNEVFEAFVGSREALEASVSSIGGSDGDGEGRDDTKSLTKRRCWLSRAMFTSPTDATRAKRGFGVLRSGKST